MITKLDEEFIITLANEGRREDGRGLEEYRDLIIQTNYVKSAEGSALVKLGDTEVLAGVKMSVGEPFPDTPDEGVLMVNAELGPKASPEFESGPPTEDAVEIARVVDRGIRESKSIDLEKICITPGEKVWMVSVDIDIINDGGNIIDASGIAAISALLSAKIPKLDKEGRPVQGEHSGNLPVREIPIPVTTWKIGNSLINDVNFEEEMAAEARLTVTSIEKLLCAMQKGGEGRLKTQEVYDIVEKAFKRAKEIRKTVKAAVK